MRALGGGALVLLVGATSALATASLWDRLFQREFRYAGTVEAREVNVPARVSSAIAKVAVDEGDAVKKGHALVELDCEDYKLAASIADRDFRRSEQLYKSGSMPFDAYDRNRNKRDLASLNIDWCAIASPINGVVLARLHEPGEWASPGLALMTLADLDELYAYVYVPQTLLHKLRPGDQVSAYLPEAGDAARRGRIAFVRPEAEFTPKNVQTREERTRLVFGVKILLENADRVLKPGMPIEIVLAK
jgi:HlyD family secretion protein